MEKKNIVCCCDSNYLQHVAVLLCSMYENNRNLEDVCIHLITIHVKKEEIIRLDKQLQQYGWFFKQYQIDDIKERIGVEIPPTISIASYIRLFLPSILDISIKIVLYLDCDIIINGSILPLFEQELSNYYIAGALDVGTKKSAQKIGLINDFYYNAGMLLINLDLWRKEHLQDKCIAFLRECGGCVYHHDQGLINRICMGGKLTVSPEWNVLTAYYDFSYEYLIKYCNTCYSKIEIEKAKGNPLIIHFTPSLSNRPWMENCNHPYKYLYRQYQQKTAWRGIPIQKDNRKFRLRFLTFIYHYFPISLYEFVLKVRSLISNKI
ncbi:glycosyltransferase family 8 protein [Bacteroides zhangwenhongii]|uniref:glycosyltransferase family 8 protein n=1 Tax=Bacteroides zhangwenhongii TaxID=2650157 RepID=UPI003AAA6074